MKAAMFGFRYDNDWLPLTDEDGDLLQIEYGISATDDKEQPVGEEYVFTSDNQADESLLHDHAKRLAQSIAKAYPDAAQRTNWKIGVCASNKYEHPSQEGFFILNDLLDE